MNSNEIYREALKPKSKLEEEKKRKQESLEDAAITKSAWGQWLDQPGSKSFISTIINRRDNLILKACVSSRDINFPAEEIKKIMAIVADLTELVEEVKNKAK